MTFKVVKRPLAELLELVIDHRGKTPNKLGFDDFSTSGIPVLSAKHVKTEGLTDLGAMRFASAELYTKWMKVEVREGDIVLTSEAPMGEVFYINNEQKYLLGQRVFGLRPNKQLVRPQYLATWLASAVGQRQMAARASGSTVQGIRQSELLKIEVDLPPIEEQERITNVRFSLVDKIAINHRINQTLETMAQAIFKSWFVDFDPVKAKIAAKAEGRDPLRAAMSAISGKTDDELDTLPPEQHAQLAATAVLFPDEMDQSELEGGIPKGWTISTLAQIAQAPSGKIEVSALNTSTYVSTENMLENRGGICEASSLPSTATVPSFTAGQVLVSNIRPYFKKLWLTRFNGGRSNDVLAFQPLNADCSEYLFNLLYQDQFFEFMTRTSKGAKMPRGDKGAIAGWKFVCADISLLKQFSERVRPFYRYIDSLGQESKVLASTKDLLLPKLLSGELQVQNIEPEVAA
jgi:type I restriction enzyme S subunit